MDIAAKLAKLDAEANRRSAEIVTVNALIATPAQPLMVIVPDSGDGGGDGKEGAGTTAEVMIANQDIGFVNPGQMAEVKLETFPHTRYGTLKPVWPSSRPMRWGRTGGVQRAAAAAGDWVPALPGAAGGQ